MTTPACQWMRLSAGLQAVTQGRWLLIEDINMAPVEVLAGLVPLLEARQLPLPQRGEVVRAAAGFQLLASVTTAPGRPERSVAKTAASGWPKAPLCGSCTCLHSNCGDPISVFLRLSLQQGDAASGNAANYSLLSCCLRLHSTHASPPHPRLVLSFLGAALSPCCRQSILW